MGHRQKSVLNHVIFKVPVHRSSRGKEFFFFFSFFFLINFTGYNVGSHGSMKSYELMC